MKESNQVMSTQKANSDSRAFPPIHKLHFDIWHQILTYLPDVSRRTLTHLNGHRFPLWSDQNQLKHQKVWDIIVDNYKFLEYLSDCGYLCVLVGSDLQYLYNYNSREALCKRSLKDHNDLNLALVILRGDEHSKSVAYQLRRIDIINGFIDSARKELKRQINISDTRWDVPGTLRIRHNFAKGKSCTIRLNIQSLKQHSDSLSIQLGTTCGTLVSLEGDYLNSAYLYWKYDWNLLRLIEPVDIVGVGRYASVRSTKKWVEDVCGLKIQHPAEIPELCRDQTYPIPDFKKKRPKSWKLVYSAFQGRNFPCQLRFHKDLTTDSHYKANHELLTNWHKGWERYNGDKDWETDPVMEKRILLSQEL